MLKQSSFEWFGGTNILGNLHIYIIMFISLNNWFNPHVFFEQPPRHTATTHGPPAATWSHGASCTGARGTRGHQVHQGGSLRCRASNGKSWGNNGNIQKLMFIIYSWENHLYIILYIYIHGENSWNFHRHVWWPSGSWIWCISMYF